MTAPTVVGLRASVDQLMAVVHADDVLGHQRWTLTAVDNTTTAKPVDGLSQVEQWTVVDSTTTVQHR